MSTEILMLLNNIKYQILNNKNENFSVESDEVARLESLKSKLEQLQIKIRDSESKLNLSQETKPLTELNTTTQTQEAVEKIKWVFIAIGSFFGLLFLLTIGYWIYSMTQSNTSVSNTYSESIPVVSAPKSIVANTPKFVDFEESTSKPANIESIQKSASIPVESKDSFSSFFNQTSKPVQNTVDTSSNTGISVTKSFSNNLENTSRSPQTSIGINETNIYDENTGISKNLFTKNIYDDSYRSINDTFDYPKNNNKLSGGKKGVCKKIK